MEPDERKTGFALLAVFLFASVIPVFLYALRQYDNSRLTSWLDVASKVNAVNAVHVYLTIILGLALAYFISKTSFIYRSPALLLFVFSFLASSVFWLEPEVIIDASRYFTQAKHLETYGIVYFLMEWGRDIFAWTDLPLVPFLYGLIFKFFGESRLYIQILNSFFLSSTVVLTYLIGRDLWDEEHGLWAGGFLLSIQYLFTQTPLMLVDTASMFFLTLSVYSFRRALIKGGVIIWVSVFSVFAAVMTKYSLWPALSALVVIFFAGRPNAPGTVLRRGLYVFFGFLMLITPVVLLKYDVILEQINILTGYQRAGLRRWGESFTSIFFFQMHPFVPLCAMVSVYAAFRKRDKKYIAVAWLVSLALIGGVRRIRYIIPLFPMVALMASYGLGLLSDRRVKSFIVFAAVFSSLAIGMFAYLPYLKSLSSINLKNAGEYLDSISAPAVEVFTFSSERDINPAVAVPLLDIYTKKRIFYDYSPAAVKPPEGFLSSPFRFTWLYRNPRYYSDSVDGSAVVVITDDLSAEMPERVRDRLENYKEAAAFDISDDYRFQTKIKVFTRANGL